MALRPLCINQFRYHDLIHSSSVNPGEGPEAQKGDLTFPESHSILVAGAHGLGIWPLEQLLLGWASWGRDMQPWRSGSCQ